MVFYEGDKVLVKDLPHLNKKLIGQAGKITKWLHGEVYSVEIADSSYILFGDELNLVTLTWERLATTISQWTPEQRQTDVTVFLDNEGEFYPIQELGFATEDENDELDAGHPYLRVKQ